MQLVHASAGRHVSKRVDTSVHMVEELHCVNVNNNHKNQCVDDVDAGVFVDVLVDVFDVYTVDDSCY